MAGFFAGERRCHMKKLIIASIVTFILLAGMSSNASDGMITAKTVVEPRSDVAQLNSPQTIAPAFSSRMPNLPIFLLFVIGMVGISGVSRKNNL